MFLKEKSKLTLTDLLESIEQIKNAELCRDFTAAAIAFAPFWSDYHAAPEIPPETDPSIRAEIMRLAGFFLSYSGKARNVRDFQERAKDLLTVAIEVFDELGYVHKAAEAKVMLALCYWYEGSIDESRDILNAAEAVYENNQLHPVYQQIQINRLLVLYRHDPPPYTESFEVLDKIRIPMEFCKDSRLQAMYHNQAGIFHQLIGRNDQAFFHLQNAIAHAKSIGSPWFEAVNLNNLALVCADLDQFEKALDYVRRALIIFEATGATGWIACLLDTKAQILLRQNRLRSALTAVAGAVDIFSAGDDYYNLTNALFLRVRIYFGLGKIADGLKDFADLLSIATVRLGEAAVEKYTRDLSELIYLKKNLAYREEVAAFQKHLVTEALIAGDRQIVKSAKILGVKQHQNLSEILNNQFPELYEELEIPRRQRRNSVSITKPVTAAAGAKTARQIKILKMDAGYMFFPVDPAMIDSSVICFVADGETSLPLTGFGGDALLLCRPAHNYDGRHVIAGQKTTPEIIAARIGFDDFTTTYFIENLKTGQVEPVEDYKIYGAPFAFCPLEKAGGERVEFQPLPDNCEGE